MIKNNGNPFINFYGKHNISPVHQNISDIQMHLIRREKLYKTIGIPVLMFKDRNILEVGPGGGYNSIPFFQWGAYVDFVEPNPTAQEELPKLMKEYEIPQEIWNLTNCTIEEYTTDKKYAVVIAEGFIPGLIDRKLIIDQLSKLVDYGGIVVVTCVDDVSIFFESIKRVLAFKLVNDVDNFNQKVSLLCKAFESHLKNLKYASRFIEDYVIDAFLNPASIGQLFSISDCINEFGDNFELLGASPNMFTDYSWYKDIGFNSKEHLLQQFYTKRHLFIMTGLDESIRTIEKNIILFNLISEFRQLARRMEESFDETCFNIAVEYLYKIKEEVKDFDSKNRISTAIEEAIMLLNDPELDCDKISKACNLAEACGRGQQYVSMIKKYTVAK